MYGAIDIGGTKIACGLFDDSLKLLDKKTVITDTVSGADGIIKQCVDTMNSVVLACGATSADIHCVGVACPGPLDLASGRIIHIPTMGLKDVPLKYMLEKKLRCHVEVQNDTNAGAIAEYFYGGQKGTQVLVYITLSTGIGAGIMINGKILNGEFSGAGELGHITVERNGRHCPCGKRGCLETYASGTGISSIASELTGTEMSAKEVFRKAKEGDEICTKVIEDAGNKLAMGISMVSQIIDCGAVIFGGSVSRDLDILMPHIKKGLHEYLEPNPMRKTVLAKSIFDGEQVLLGAAHLAKEKNENK